MKEEKIVKKLVDRDEQLDKIIQKLIDHDRQLEIIDGRLGKTATTDEINERFDEVMTILKKLDQERVFTTEWVRGVKKVVDHHTKEINRIKQEFKIA